MRFFLNTNFIIERNACIKINEYIKDNIGNVENPGLIYDKVLNGQGYFEDILLKIKKSFPSIEIKINEKEGEPTYQYLNELSNYFRKKNIDSIIAIGGGSTMDLGKGIAFLMTNKGNALEYKGFPENVNDPVPLITCPSLFGSGADVSYNAVFIDESEGRKLGINSTKNFPNLSILDAELTMKAPESAIISSSMDTLVHCVDSFGSPKSSPMSRMYSVKGFRNTFEVLKKSNHMDIEYREKLALGSICGITALMNSGDGPTNGFAYYLGVKYNVPHGLAGAIFLKEVMKYNVQEMQYDGYSFYRTDESSISSSHDLISDLEKMYDSLGIPNLVSFGLTEYDMEKFIDGSMNALAGSFAGNPVDFGREAVEYVYKNLIKEK